MKQGSFKIGLIRFRYCFVEPDVALVQVRALRKGIPVKVVETFYNVNSLKELKEAVANRFGLS